MKSSIKQKSFSAKQGKTGPSLMGAWADTTGSTQQKRSTTITQPKTFHSGGELFKNQNSTLFLTLLKTTRVENLFPIKRKWARQRLVWSWHFPSSSVVFSVTSIPRSQRKHYHISSKKSVRIQWCEGHAPTERDCERDRPPPPPTPHTPTLLTHRPVGTTPSPKLPSRTVPFQ